MSKYHDLHRASIETPEEFWAQAAEGIDWEKRWDRVIDNPEPLIYRWFSGGQLNTCYNAVDRHVERGRGDQVAIIYDSAVTNTQRKITYAELRDEVAHFAGALAANGVGKGDRVIVYMPMIPQAIIAVLACARLGAVHSVVFGGFAAAELATRIDDAKPTAIVSASCASSRRDSSNTSRCSMRPSRLPATSPPAASSSSGRRSKRRSLTDVTSTGKTRLKASHRMTALPSRQPTPCTCCTRRERPGSRKASFAITAATLSPCTGR